MEKLDAIVLAVDRILRSLDRNPTLVSSSVYSLLYDIERLAKELQSDDGDGS